MKRKRREKVGPALQAQDPVLTDSGIFEKSLKISVPLLFERHYYYFLDDSENSTKGFITQTSTLVFPEGHILDFC